MKKASTIFKLIKDSFQKVLKSNSSARIAVCCLITFLILAVPFVFYEIVYAKTINLGEADDIIYIEGNVGIGTTGPPQALSVAGKIAISRNSAFTYPFILREDLASADARSGLTISSRRAMNYIIDGANEGIYAFRWIAGVDDAFDNTKELMRLTRAGNVGIGTTSPGYKLDVSGTGRFTNPVIVGTPTGDTHAATKSYVDSAAGGGVGAGSSGQTLRHDGTSWVANSLLYNNGTNVGIGTTSPTQAKLVVSGDIAIPRTQGFIFLESISGTERASIKSSNIDPYNELIFSAGAVDNEVMRLLPSGNVAIGATTTSYKLDVQGTGRFTNPVIVGTPTGDTHAATKSYVDSAAGGGVGAGSSGQTLRHDGTSWVANSLLYNNGTNVGIGTTSPGADLHVLSDLAGHYGQVKIGTDSGVAIDLFAHLATTTYGVGEGVSLISGRIHGSTYIISRGNSSDEGLFFGNTSTGVYTTHMSILESGNVGIGTTSPGYKLDVSGTGRFTNPVIVGTPTGDTHAATKSYVDSAAGGGVGAGSSGQTLRHDGTSWVGSSLLYNNGTNIGIGTTSPTSKLDIAGGAELLTLGNIDYTAGDYLNIIEFGTGGDYQIIHEGSGAFGRPTLALHANSTHALGFYSTGWVPLLEVEGGTGRTYIKGNVGIGTASPGYKLDVIGEYGAKLAKFTASGAQSLYLYGDAGGVGLTATDPYTNSALVYLSESDKIDFYTGSTHRMIINSSGNVGIGTTSPDSILHISTDSSSSGALRIQRKASTGEASMGFYGHTDATNRWVIGVAGWGHTDDFTIGQGSAGFLIENSSGNVGIGTTSPGYKLDVQGTGRFTSPVIVGTPTGDTHATLIQWGENIIDTLLMLQEHAIIIIKLWCWEETRLEKEELGCLVLIAPTLMGTYVMIMMLTLAVM